MPSRRLPNSLPAVLRTLTTARGTWENTQETDRAISPAQFAQLDPGVTTNILNRLLKEAGEVDLALAAQAPLSSTLAQTAAQLTLFCSHFHQVFDLGIARGLFAPGDRPYYGRDINDTALPALSTYNEVQEAAEKIATGEAARISFGSVQMTNPSAAEVATAFTAFKNARTASQSALTATDREREETQAVYAEAQPLAVDICETVEFFYRADPSPSSRRAKCRRWGVVYLYGDQETPDPGDTPAPPVP